MCPRPVARERYHRHGALESVDAGAVAVDDHLRTSQPHVFAMGDVNGGPQFTYVSLDDYRIVLDQLAGSGTRSTTDRTAVPYTLFMTPPLARVGLTERDARADGRRVVDVVSLAMRHGITATQLRDEIYTHPSMTEAFNQLLAALA
ncbi:FAD-dependent oxidoreductase [Mycobacterium sp. AT1]|uniref:FAD-dependent oxidoreductase n=1 Tax=Mycobacterium sp. AT1 TaxID=1961706 RepID=UPI001E29A3B9|nr:FAD-dependent oxidoreductase [Mycobacterium sp. AT1]